MKKNIYVLVQVLIIAFFSLPTISQTNKCLTIGMNVGDPNRYNGAYSMFKNVMLSSEAFTTESIYGGTDNYSYIPTDVNGYPNAGLPYSTTVYENCCGFVAANAMTIVTQTMQECPRDFPWGAALTPTDSAGIYYAFWEGSGTLYFEWNYGQPNIIATAGTYGTITTSGTSYYGGTKVPNLGISSISSGGVISNNTAGLHYCQIRIANYYNGDNPTNHGDPGGLSGGLKMRITQSAVAPNHLRNVAVVMPNARALDDHSIIKVNPSLSYDAYAHPQSPEFFLNKPFNPMYINWLKPFKLLRFMVAMGANSIDFTYDQTWQTRRPKGYYSQNVFKDGRVGVSMAYEWLIDIANETGADAWINASATGDVNHYQQMARLFHQNLNPDQNVYLELGNEQWNFAGGFNTFFVLNNYAAVNGIGVSEASAIKEGQLWKAFFDEYGMDSSKCKRVMSGFAGNPDVTHQKLVNSIAHGINWDYFSITWYFSNDANFITTPYNANSTTPAQYNTELQTRIGIPSYGFVSQITAMSNFAMNYKKKVLGYEGGSGSWEFPGVTQQDPALLSKFDNSVRQLYQVVLDTIRNHPEMEAVCQFSDFGGGASGPANGGWHGYGAIPSVMTDTSSTTGNGNYAASFGTYAYTGTNKHAVWKELIAQEPKPAVCSPQASSDNVGPGNALEFNNAKLQYVDFNSSTNLASTGDFSFEIWVKPEITNAVMDVLAFTNTANSSLNALRIDATNKINWVVNNSTGSQVVNLAGPALTAGRWYHIAAEKQGNNYKLLVNGSLAANGSGTGTFSSNRVQIGSSIVNSSAVANYFNGQVDELRVWNGAVLGTNSIRDFMCKKLKPTHPNYANLSNYITFNSVVGFNLFDLQTGTYANNALKNFTTVSGTNNYKTSGAPIGDESISIYPGGAWTSVALTYTNPIGGDIIQLSGMGNGLPDGAHLYVVNQTPTLNALPQYYISVGQTKFYGVFMANGTDPNYNIKYFYQGNPGISGTDAYNRLIKRGSNADPAWVNGGAILDNISKSLTISCREKYRSEYNIGVRQANALAKSGAGTAVSFNMTTTGQGGVMRNFFRTNDYTLSFWARNRGGGGNVVWFGEPNGNGYGQADNMYAVYGGGLGTRFDGLQYGGGNNGAATGRSGEWNHYAITKEGTALVLYTNGIPTAGGPDPTQYFFSEMHIASHAWEYSSDFGGDIDELSVWSKALSLDEIRSLMCTKITPAHPEYCSLDAYFRFDEGQGSIVENAVGGGDMVMTGVTWINSGASLGDVSAYNYSSPNAVTLIHPDGDAMKLDYILRGNLVLGTQMFRVDDAPYYTGTVPSGITSMDNSRYWGIYEIGQQDWQTNSYSMNYKLTYNYAANKNINLAQESTLTALDRADDGVMDWSLFSSTRVDNTAKKMTIIPGAYSITGVAGSSFTVPNHGFQTCDMVSYYYEGTPMLNSGGSSYPLNNQEHVRVIDANTISLHTYWNTSDCASGANPDVMGTLGTGAQFFIKVNTFRKDEVWVANSNVNGFINTTAIPTVGGVNGKATVCQSESNLIYRIKAPVDINAKQFIWMGSNGLAVGTSNTDTVNVSIIAKGASIETLSVVGINRNGKTTPPYIFTITVNGTGSLSADITGALNVCGSSPNVPYSIAGVSPSPISYIWSVTGVATISGPSTNSSVLLNFDSNQGNAILSVYGNYACGTALINSVNIKNYKAPDITLKVTGETVCSPTSTLDPAITIFGSENGVVYSAYDITSTSIFVGSIVGSGSPAIIRYPRALLTPWSARTIQVKASNGPCTPPATLNNTASIMLSNTLTGAELAGVIFNGPTTPSCFDGGINLYSITLTGTRPGVTYTPYVFDYNQNYPYYEFSYVMGNDVVATGNSAVVLVNPNVFPYWFSFTRPNTIGGMAMAPGCPSQKLPNNFNMQLKRSAGVAIPSKVMGFPKGVRQAGDDDDFNGICSANTGTFYTTAWGGNPDIFVGREVFGTSIGGNPVITITSKTISLADIDIDDVLYTVSNVGEVASYGFSLNGNPLYVISKTANTLQVSFTKGGAAAVPNSSLTNFRFWATVTIPVITSGSQKITIPAKYAGHGLRLYSQIIVNTASTMPSPWNCSSCDHKYYVASISGNNFIVSRMPTQWTAGQETSMNFNVERGTLSLTNGSTIVNGTGTRFGTGPGGANVVDVGDILRDSDDAVIGIVASVANTTQLTLTSAYTGPTRAGVSYGFMRPLVFGSNGQSVVISAPTDAWDGSNGTNGFNWQVTPLEAVTSIIGTGGSYSAASGEYIGNATLNSSGVNTAAGQGFSAKVRNGVTIMWNPTFAGTAYVAVKVLNQCGESVYDNREAYTPGYERSKVYVNIRANVPGTPDPISFAQIPLCQAPGNTLFTTVAQTSGGYQWQLFNAGSSSLYQPFYACGGCNYHPTSTIPGLMWDGTSTCTGTIRSDCVQNGGTVGVSWNSNFTGVALIRVRAYGCDNLTASPWVMTNVTINGPGDVYPVISGPSSRCVGAGTSTYSAIADNSSSFTYFLLPSNIPDIYTGLMAAYSMSGNANNVAFGYFSMGSGGDGIVAGGSFTTDRFGNASSAFQSGGGNIKLPYFTNVLGSSWTVSAWIKPNGVNTNKGIIGEYGGLTLYLVNGQLALGISDGNPNYFNQFNQTISGVLPLSVWQQVAITSNRSPMGTTIVGYVNGVSTYYTTIPGNINIPRWGGNANIGMDQFWGGGSFGDPLDDVMLYNRGLSSTEMLYLYAVQSITGYTKLTDLSTPIGNINNPLVGAVDWVSTFVGTARIGVVAAACGGYSNPVYYTVTTTSVPTITGVTIQDPTSCLAGSSGTALITIAGFTGAAGTVFDADLNGGGFGSGNVKNGTIDAGTVITINSGLPSGYTITQLRMKQTGGLCIFSPDPFPVSTVIGGIVPPSLLVPVSLQSASPQCTGSDAIVRLTGSESNIFYYAQLNGTQVSTTVAGTGGIIDLSITGANLLTSNGANMSYTVNVVAILPGCNSFTLTGTALIDVNPLANAGTITGGGNQINVGSTTGAMTLNGQTGTIAGWQRSFNGGSSVSIPATAGLTSYAESPTVPGVYSYKVLVTSDICNSTVVSLPVQVTVSGNGGIVRLVSTSGIVCQGVSSGLLTLTGYSGSILRWEYSSDEGQSFTPISNITDSYTHSSLNSVGIWQFRAVVFGNKYSIPQAITVTSPPVVKVAYDDTPYCSSILKTPAPHITITGGVFSLVPGSAGISVNSTSGIITILAATGYGQKQVYYSVSTPGCNPTQIVATLSITGAPKEVSLTYAGTEVIGTDSYYCKNNSIPATPAQTGFSGGYFSSNSLPAEALAGTFTSTGALNLKKITTDGSYDITYTYNADNYPGCTIPGATYVITVVSSMGGKAVATPGKDICEGSTINLALVYPETSNANLTSLQTVQWMEQINGQWTNIADATTAVISTGTLSGITHYYQARTRFSNCPVSNSQADTVEVSASPVAGKVQIIDPVTNTALDSTITLCNIFSTTLTSVGSLGSNVQWLYSEVNGSSITGWTTVPGLNASSYITPPQELHNASQYFMAAVSNGACTTPVYTVPVKITQCGQNRVLPNALTPNSDGKNSTWDLSELNLRDDGEVKIFNRYGQEVFKSTGLLLKARGGWDGSNLPAGTYYYVVNMHNVNGDNAPIRGAVTIIK